MLLALYKPKPKDPVPFPYVRELPNDFTLLYEQEMERWEQEGWHWEGEGYAPQSVRWAMRALVAQLSERYHFLLYKEECEYPVQRDTAMTHRFYSLYEDEVKGTEWTGKGYEPNCVHTALVRLAEEVYANTNNFLPKF